MKKIVFGSLLAVLLLHGITPGRELMTQQLPLVFVVIWSLFLSNWLTSNRM